MSQIVGNATTGRRQLLTATAVISGLQLASPFIIKARGVTPVKIGIAYAMMGVTADKGVFHVVPGGHTDPITGSGTGGR